MLLPQLWQESEKEMNGINVFRKYGWMIALVMLGLAFVMVMPQARPDFPGFITWVTSIFAQESASTVVEARRSGPVSVGAVAPQPGDPTNLRDLTKVAYTAGMVVTYADWSFSCSNGNASFGQLKNTAFVLATPCPTDNPSFVQTLKALRDYIKTMPESLSKRSALVSLDFWISLLGG